MIDIRNLFPVGKTVIEYINIENKGRPMVLIKAHEFDLFLNNTSK